MNPITFSELVLEEQDIQADIQTTDELQDSVSDASQDSETLKKISDVLEQNPDGLSPSSTQLTEIATESLYRRLGVQKKARPALESMGRKEYVRLALEENDTVIQRVLAALSAAIKKIVEFIKALMSKVKNFFTKLLGFSKERNKKTEEIIKESEATIHDAENIVKNPNIDPSNLKSKAFSTSPNSDVDVEKAEQILKNAKEDTLVLTTKDIAVIYGYTPQHNRRLNDLCDDILSHQKHISTTSHNYKRAMNIILDRLKSIHRLDDIDFKDLSDGFEAFINTMTFGQHPANKEATASFYFDLDHYNSCVQLDYKLVSETYSEGSEKYPLYIYDSAVLYYKDKPTNTDQSSECVISNLHDYADTMIILKVELEHQRRLNNYLRVTEEFNDINDNIRKVEKIVKDLALLSGNPSHAKLEMFNNFVRSLIRTHQTYVLEWTRINVKANQDIQMLIDKMTSAVEIK